MDYTLSRGKHASPEQGLCAMEFVAYLAGEPHTDHPVCVDGRLAAFVRGLNDVMTRDERQRLRPLLARMIGTAGDGKEAERASLAEDWLTHGRRCSNVNAMRMRPSTRCV